MEIVELLSEVARDGELRSILEGERKFADLAHADRLERYHAALSRTGEVAAEAWADWERTGEEWMAHAAVGMANCGRLLWTRYYYEIDETRISKALLCRRSMCCSLCAIRRAAAAVERYLEKWRVIQEAHPGAVLWHVVLTVKNGPDISERYDHLGASWRALTKRWKFARDHPMAPRVPGGDSVGFLWTREITYGKGGFHPHAHVLIAMDEEMEIDEAALSQTWQSITGDSFIVHAERTYAPEGDEDAEARPFLEAFKYVIKSGSMDAAMVWGFAKALRGRRFIGGGGAFRGIKTDTPEGDPLLDDQPFVERLYEHTADGYVMDYQAHSSEPWKLAEPGVRTFGIHTRKKKVALEA